MSLYQRLMTGCLLLIVLVTSVSFLVRASFLQIASLESQVRIAEHAVAALETAQASLAQEEIFTAQTSLEGEVAFHRFEQQAHQTQTFLAAAVQSTHVFDASVDVQSIYDRHARVLRRTTLASMRLQNLRDRDLMQIQESYSTLVDQVRAKRHEVVSHLHEQEDALRTRLITACGISIFLAILISGLMVASLILPLRRTAQSARQIGGGDLTHRVEWRSGDDLGVIAAEINRMAVRLRDLRETEAGRRQMDQQLSDAVVHSIFEPVIVTDAKGHVLKLNRSAQQLLGEASSDRNALANTPGGDRILEAIRNAVSMQRAATGEGEAALLPMRIGQAEHSYRLRTTPIRDDRGRLLGAVTLLEDITEMAAVDRFKSRFLMVASQKLRDPLQRLRLSLYTLTRGFAGPLQPLQMDIARNGEEEAERLDDLMADLLEVAELDTGDRELQLHALRPLDVLQDASSRHRGEAQDKRIRLCVKAYEDLPHVAGDRRALRSILDNLIQNSLRYTPSEGEVRLEATELRDRVQFSVTDTGRGIEPERLPGIFGRFSGTGAAGTGLGLALVRRLVEAQNGEVAVESRLGHGTTFRFTLPIAAVRTGRHPVEAG
uniref:histidine kinase n=1 Tax=Acidobacterium capsulatum TaxID=33075 RepID=A0A7V5CU94_9BACT